jgi:tetratricopeptide (TPR) repeat protein
VSEPRGSSANRDEGGETRATPSPLDGDAAAGRIADLERRLSAAPDSPLFFELARAHWDLGQVQRAGEVLRQGLQHHPDHLPARLLHAEALLSRGKAQSCAREMARVLQRDPSRVPAMLLLARALMAQDQVEEALVVLDRARDLAPDDRAVQHWQRDAEQALAAAEPDEAATSADPPREIGVIEPDGHVVALDAVDPRAPLPGFTGYIRAIAAPRPEFSGMETIPPLPPLPSPAVRPGESPSGAFRGDPDASDDDGGWTLSPPADAPAEIALPALEIGLSIGGEAAGNDADEDEDVTRAEDIPPSLLGEPPAPPPPHPTTGGSTREALSPAFRTAEAPVPAPPAAPPAPTPATVELPVAVRARPSNPRAFARAEERPGGSLLLAALQAGADPAGDGTVDGSASRPPEAAPEPPAGRAPRAAPDSIVALGVPAPSVRAAGPVPVVAVPAPIADAAARPRPAVDLPRFDWEVPEPPAAPVAVPPTAPSLPFPEPTHLLTESTDAPDALTGQGADDDLFMSAPSNTAGRSGGPPGTAPAARSGLRASVEAPRTGEMAAVSEPTHMTAPPEPTPGPARPATVRLARKGPGAGLSLDEMPPSTPPAPASPPPAPVAAARSELPRLGAPPLDGPGSVISVLHTEDVVLEESLGPQTPPGGVARARRAESGAASSAERPRPSPPVDAPRPGRPAPPPAEPGLAPGPDSPPAPARAARPGPAPAAAPPAPRKAPPPAPAPPAAPDRAALANLLDEPLDPGDFDDMPPKPPVLVDRPPPADLSQLELSGELPAPRGPARPAPPPPAPEPPPRKAARGAEAPELKPIRPAAKPAAPATPAAEPAPKRPQRAHRPVAADPAEPPPSAEPAAPAGRRPPPAPAPAPPPEPARGPGRFDSVFDARVDPDRPATDALGNIVVAQKQRAPQTLAPQPVAAAQGAAAGRLRLVLPIALAVVLLATLTTTWRYRATANRLERAVATARQQVSQGTWPGTVAAVNALSEADAAPDPFARFGNALIRALGRPGIEGRRGDLVALRARLEAQRVTLFGETERREAAAQAVQRATTEAPDREDTALATAWQALDGGQAEQARQRLEPLAARRAGDADVRWVTGVACLAAGQSPAGVEHLRAALQAEPAHVGALKALADHRAARGEHTAALDAYKQILASYSPDHLETRVALARLQIRLGKREAESRAELEGLSTDPTLSSPQRALVYDALGEAAVHRGDLTAARRQFQQAKQTAPADPRYAAGLAALDMRELKLDDAEAVLGEAARAHPENLRYLEHLAELRLMRGDADGALRRLASAPQKSASILLLEGRALIARGDPRSAEAVLRDARDALSGSLDVRIYRALAAYLQNRSPRGLEDLRALRKPGEGDDRLEDRALPFRAYGEALLAADDRRAAMDAFKVALQIDPRDFLSAWGLCRLAVLAGDPARALQTCRETVRLNPYYLPAVDQAAAINETRGDSEAVIALLAPLLSRDADHPAAVRRLARAYLQTNDPENARKLLDGERAVSDPASRRYVQGLVDLHTGRLPEALTALGAAADELPGEPFVQLARADALMKDGKVDMAGGFYRRALVAGAGAEAGIGAARAWMLRSRWTDALASAREALARAERDRARPALVGAALALIAEAQFASGDRRGAAEAIGQAVSVAGTDHAVLITAGRLAEAEGRAPEALAHYQRAAQVRADSAEARYYLGRLLVGSRDRADEGRDALEQAVRLDRDGRFGTLAEDLLRKRP